ncbi:MAG: glycosyltransferase [Acetobacter sp.]|jgi:GT2 family glycosyltransferase|nr:glycosyltransferase [Acetobacter sp.]MCH4060174.1 glycosyltransferase [Acetobacter sp.]MCH4087114.1 glycosyltransferase [Acetobacter sp.]MCI1292934.1 glycosyltransferase [Acetobacter sp.]MCI1319520.1 glycosyltransferase [Acetobacter sp.]
MTFISIIICTDGRPAALQNTLSALQYLYGPDFEVCVVRGPTCDGIDDVLSRWHEQIKIACNPLRNLSISRNIGIQMASGDLIAFIDDDGIPEAEWLEQVIEPFSDPQTGAAGGIVMDHTGARPQYLYASANRLGMANCNLKAAATDLNFPESFNFPYVQGTNSIFRRSALMDVGCFDEEFDFYLDETDLCCRLIDAGWHIAQLDNAIVHHKFLPSQIRTEDRVTRSLYQVLKNKLYFSIVNNHGHYSRAEIRQSMEHFVRAEREGIKHHISNQRLSPEDLVIFDQDARRAWETGWERGYAGVRHLIRHTVHADAFALRFPRKNILQTKETVIFVQASPTPSFEEIKQFSDAGCQVHLILHGEKHDRVDFEDGIWIHRPAWFTNLSPVTSQHSQIMSYISLLEQKGTPVSNYIIGGKHHLTIEEFKIFLSETLHTAEVPHGSK